MKDLTDASITQNRFYINETGTFSLILSFIVINSHLNVFVYSKNITYFRVWENLKYNNNIITML